MIHERIAVLAGVLLLGASAVSAEVVLTPFAGVAFGGTTEKSHGTYGASLAFLGQVTGLEVEFGITPHFFGDGGSAGFFTTNDVATLMGSLVVAFSTGAVRPYGAVGAGLLKTRLEDADRLLDVNSSDFGINAGGGLIAYIGHTVGLRADVRYFRSLSDVDADGVHLGFGTVDYWRAVGGISLRF